MPSEEWETAFGVPGEDFVKDKNLITGETRENSTPPSADAVPPNYAIISHADPSIVEADSYHAAMEELARQNAAMRARLDKYENPQPVISAPLGGPPVPHHLHLVDGRVITNHEGTGTHYSETLPDGREVVTRIIAHYPVSENTPTPKLG